MKATQDSKHIKQEKNATARRRPHRNSGGNAKRLQDQWNRIIRLNSVKVFDGVYEG